jgi:integrase
MEDFWAVVKGTGNDPELDELVCQTILITGARREGLTNLVLRGIDRDECTVRLDEKFGKIVDQPVPDWFVERLWAFAVARGASKPTDQVFRLGPRRDGTMGKPITSRRLDNVFQRVQSMLAWADKQQVTAHTLRHHAIELVERHAGKQVPAGFARHEPGDTSGLYGRASREEVARAVVDLHGGHHPWLTPSTVD